MNNIGNRIDSFWHWFATNSNRLAAVTEADRGLLDLLRAKLNEIHEGLFFEINNSLPEREFVISAYGKRELFEIVYSIVERTPKSLPWKVIALKPPRGFKFTTNFMGCHLDPGRTWFLPLKKRNDPSFLGLRVGIEGESCSACAEIIRGGILLMLDTGLGEQCASESIQYVEVEQLPNNPGSKGYGKISSLPKYIAAWKK